MTIDIDRIRAVLEGVPDPEIPVLSIIDLGIVCNIGPYGVTITPTYSGCPATLTIEQAVRVALDGAGYTALAIRTSLAPAWSTDWISPEGRDKLRAYGIAPPQQGVTAACPRCESADTEEVSRFGSTPCKAQWRCRDCLEPFDRFKCH